MEIKINLIPPYRKEEIIQTKRLWLIVRIGISILLIFLLFFFFLFGLYKILELDYLAVSGFKESGSDRVQYDKIKRYDGEFKKINAQVMDIILLRRDQLYWSNMFVKLSKTVTSEIVVSDLATNNYSIFLAGKASSRDKLIAFKEKLESEECFSEVNLPLSNLVSKENIDFQMDLKIKQECLKRK